MRDDQEAFAAFVDGEYLRLVRSLLLFCGERGLAEDLAQEAFARAHQRWRSVSQVSDPTAWLYTVAFNLARSKFRRRAAERRAYARHGPTPPATSDPARSDVLVVREAVTRLPARQREVLIHRYFLGRSVAETATLIGVSENAVKAAAHKAIRSLRASLGVSAGTREGTDHA